MNSTATLPGGFLRELARAVGREYLLTRPEQTCVFESDGLSAYRQIPPCVVLPGSITEVQRIMRACAAWRIPVVARGAGTGLSGGALPCANGILLGLNRLNAIVEIDPAARTATVMPGVTNLAISRAAAPYGLFYAPDPSSQVACTIGGNVAENSGGVHCLKYGLTLNNLFRIDWVSAEGELFTSGTPYLDEPGPDLVALLTGSEGLLGIVVRVTVRLLLKPLSSQVMLAAFPSITAAASSVNAIIASGIMPSGMEMMDRACIHAVEDYIHAGYPRNAAAIIICELDGTERAVAAETKQVHCLLEDAGGVVRIAKDKAEGDLFWAGRKAAFPAVGRISPDYYCMDGTIPRHALAKVLDAIEQLSRAYQLPVVNVFHAGDGNLHPLILYDAADPKALRKTEILGGKILALCHQAGGTITGEHGVGVEKLDQMCLQFSKEELAQFHALKEALDPKGLLNPGKAIPTLRRCVELGGQHVHAGRLPHPSLERF